MSRKRQMAWPDLKKREILRGKKCIRCDGTGEVGLARKTPCPVCHGTGRA